MSALLKMKSKIGVKRKDRVTYPVHDSLKRLRDPAGLAQSQFQPQASSTSQGQQSSRTLGQSQELLRVGDLLKKDKK